MFIPFIVTPEAPPEAPSVATLPSPPHDGTGAPVDETPAAEVKPDEPSPSELVKALPMPDERPQPVSERHPLDSSPTTEEEARRNAALAKSQRIDTAACAIAEALKGLDDSEALEAVYMGNKRARGGL